MVTAKLWRPLSNIFSFCLSEQFQFVSRRHRGFPFSITLYLNGIMVARFSSCCEYRYAPGFQQGRKSSFRLIWLAGGIPCNRLDRSFRVTCLCKRGNDVVKTHKRDALHMFRCTSLRNKYSSCQQLNVTNERFTLPLEQNPASDPRPESEHLIFTFHFKVFFRTIFVYTRCSDWFLGNANFFLFFFNFCRHRQIMPIFTFVHPSQTWKEISKKVEKTR